MSWNPRYPHARFAGPVAGILVGLVREHQEAALLWAAAGGGALAPFAEVTGSPGGRLGRVFPVCWLDSARNPMSESEDAARLEEEPRFTFWVAAKRTLQPVSGETEAQLAERQAAETEALTGDLFKYVAAVAQIFLSATQDELVEGLNPAHQTRPRVEVTETAVEGWTGGGLEFIGYGRVEVLARFREART